MSAAGGGHAYLRNGNL